MDSNSSKKFAVVTGASSGIGFELAKQFAQNGFDILIAAESDRLSEAAASLSALGAQVETAQADLASFEGVEKLYGTIQASGRPVDAIAINAGVGLGGGFLNTDLQAELNMINLNIVSTVHLAKRIVKDMLASGKGGKILFTSSIAGAMPAPFEAVYGGTKAFVRSFGQALRNELKDTGVSVTVLMPGVTDTDFFHRAGMDDTKVGAGEKDSPADVAKDGFEALMAGTDHVVAGSFKNKLQAAAGHILPDPAMAEMHRKQSEPGSANQ